MTQVQFAETGLIGTLSSSIDATTATGSFTASFKDKNTGLARVPDSHTNILAINRGGTTFEMFYGTHATVGGVTTFSYTARGLPKGYSITPLTTVSANMSAHYPPEEVSVVDIATYLNIIGLKLSGVEPIGGSLNISDPFTFTGAGVTNVRVFADATARDAAITSPVNGEMVYLTGVATLEYYGAGTWNTLTTGTVYSAGAGLDLAVGAFSVKTSDTNRFVTVSSGAGDSTKVPVLNASGKLADGFINDLWINDSIIAAKGDLVTGTAIGTPAVLTVGSDGKVLIADSGQTTGQVWGYPTIGSITASDDKWILTAGPRQNANTSYTKVWEYKVFHSGSVRCKFELKDNAGGTTVYAQVWKNGVAVGVEHSTSSSTYQPYQDDVTCVSGDLIQLYQKVPTGADYAVVQNFGLYATGLREPVLTV